MMKLGNKEENARFHDANEPERGVKRNKWETNGCRWDAEKHDIREGDAMGRQRHQRMNNAKFIPILHLVHLTSTHSARVQTALHQHEIRYLHFPPGHLKQIYCYSFVNRKKVFRSNKAKAWVSLLYLKLSLAALYKNSCICLSSFNP